MTVDYALNSPSDTASERDEKLEHALCNASLATILAVDGGVSLPVLSPQQSELVRSRDKVFRDVLEWVGDGFAEVGLLELVEDIYPDRPAIFYQVVSRVMCRNIIFSTLMTKAGLKHVQLREGDKRLADLLEVMMGALVITGDEDFLRRWFRKTFRPIIEVAHKTYYTCLPPPRQRRPLDDPTMPPSPKRRKLSDLQPTDPSNATSLAPLIHQTSVIVPFGDILNLLLPATRLPTIRIPRTRARTH